MVQENTKKKLVHNSWIKGDLSEKVMLDTSKCSETKRLTKSAGKLSLFERIEKLKSSMN